MSALCAWGIKTEDKREWKHSSKYPLVIENKQYEKKET
jgi:hypothetical protein